MSITLVAGVDISKSSLYVVIRSADSIIAAPQRFAYDDHGLALLFEHLATHRVEHVAFESTGGYERMLFRRIHEHGLIPYQLEARSVQQLACSFKKADKTDKLDCNKIALAALIHQPKPSYCPTQAELDLRQLFDWRAQLIEERTRLRNQNEKRAHQDNESMKPWFKQRQQARLEHLNGEIEQANQAIDELVKQDEQLYAKSKLLQSMPGIGQISAWGLMAKMPELGQLTRQQCAKLCGLAPQCNQSGQKDGARRTQHSRQGVKSMLWMAALSAARQKGPFKDFYDKLVEQGKHKSVARVALMRRMVCGLNAMVRENQRYEGAKMEPRVQVKPNGVVAPAATPIEALGREQVSVSSRLNEGPRA